MTDRRQKFDSIPDAMSITAAQTTFPQPGARRALGAWSRESASQFVIERAPKERHEEAARSHSQRMTCTNSFDGCRWNWPCAAKAMDAFRTASCPAVGTGGWGRPVGPGSEKMPRLRMSTHVASICNNSDTSITAQENCKPSKALESARHSGWQWQGQHPAEPEGVHGPRDGQGRGEDPAAYAQSSVESPQHSRRSPAGSRLQRRPSPGGAAEPPEGATARAARERAGVAGRPRPCCRAARWLSLVSASP